MPEVKEVFKTELCLIKDQEVRDFVIDVIDTMAPDYFWTAPASTSGKYHPRISLGEGGIIRHTKLAVWWGVELMRSMPWFDDKQEKRDAVIAALILHDLKKNGEKLVGGKPIISGITATHGIRLAEEIRMRKFPPGSVIPDTIRYVLSGIECHMGRWSKPFDPEKLNLGVNHVVHLADYCCSRKVDDKAAELLL